VAEDALREFWKKWIWNRDHKQRLFSRAYLAPYLKDHHNWVWFAMFEAFNIGDWLLTQLAVGNGFVEMNPIWHSSVTTAFSSIMKVIFLPIAVLLIPGIFKPTISRNLIRLFTIMFFMVCCENMWALAHPSQLENGEAFSHWEMLRFSLILATIGLAILGVTSGLNWLYKKVRRLEDVTGVPSTDF